MEPDEVTRHSMRVVAMMPSAGTLPNLDPALLLASEGRLTARPDTVHLWAFALVGTPERIELCRGLLSTEERQRADRFVFERDRARYTIAHAVMRNLLGR